MKLATLAALLAASLATGQPTKMLVTPGTGPIGIQKMLGGPMKGAPSSATIVTETIQTLADGNRITQRMTGSMARDSEGRMRHETILPVIGGLAVAGKAPHLVFILDPVSQTNYTVDLNA